MGDDARDLHRQVRWNGVSDLAILVGARALEEVVVWKGLDSRGFTDGPAPALCGIVMNKVVAVLADMRRNRRRGFVLDLHPEPIVEKTVAILHRLRNIFVIRQEFLRVLMQFRGR